MHTRIIILASAFFALIVAGMFVFSYLKKQELNNVPPVDTSVVTPEPPFGGIERINAKHFFIDGVHTIAGELPMPTPCDLVETTATVAESMPEQVLIDFNVINNAETCAQMVTPQRFMVSFTASSDASIRAKLKGRDVILNLIPGAAGETPESFELYIKG